MAFADYFPFVALKRRTRYALVAARVLRGWARSMAAPELLGDARGCGLGVCSVPRKSLAGINLREKRKGKFLKGSHHEPAKKGEREKNHSMF